MIEDGFEQLLTVQSAAMLAVGRRLHPETFDSARERSYRLLPVRWKDQVRIEFVEGIDVHARALGSTAAIVDHGRNLSGLFIPADPSDGSLPLIEVDNGSFFRKHFTAFHELGHFLQRADLDCFARLYDFDDKAVAKRFEELACNRFAAEVLLPETLVRQCLTQGGMVAGDACRLFREARLVSRQAVTRRLSGFLPDGGSIAFFDAQGQLAVRATVDGRPQYGVEPTQVESRMLEELHRSDRDELVLDAAELGIASLRRGRVSAARSRSNRGFTAFVVVNGEP